MAKQGVTKIDIKQVLAQKAPKASRKIPGFIVDYLIRTVHQEELNDILTRYHDKEGVDFMRELIGYFDLTLDLVHEENIPTEGRYIFASNHPLGGLDGICLSAVIGSRFEGRIKYPVNDLLLYLSNLKSIFVPINKHGTQGKDNARMLEEAFASDDQIITFPAGLCSRKIGGKIQDLEWKKSFIQKAVQYKRDIVPVYFDGKNSNFFYNLARIRKALGIKMNYEMIYLPDEMFRSKHKTFRIYFGKVTMYNTYNQEARNMILYFLGLHFPDADQLITPVYPLETNMDVEKMRSLFPHDNFKDNYKVLNQEVRKFGINVPPLVNAYMSLSPKMRVFGTAINHEFGEVEETGILIAINEILEDKKKRHIETYLEEEYKSAELIRKNFIGE